MLGRHTIRFSRMTCWYQRKPSLGIRRWVLIVWTVDPATLPGAYPGPKRRQKLGGYRYPEVRSVEKVAAGLPPEAWQPFVLREGAKGPLVHEFAAIRVWAMRHYKAGPPIWLVLRRTTEHTDLKYYVSNASAETPWQQIALAGGSRGGWKNFLKTGRRTWEWPTTRLVPGTVGIIT